MDIIKLIIQILAILLGGLAVLMSFPLFLRLHWPSPVGVLFILFAIGSGATVLGKWFRIYSVSTILTLVLFGVLTGLEAPRMEANLPTPWMGVYERINIYGFMLWNVILVIIMLHRGNLSEETKKPNL